MQITVPPAEPKTSAWRKTITALGAGKGGGAVEGVWLQPGDVVDVPVGTLVVAVDKVTTGHAYTYRGGEPYAVQDATVTVSIVAAEGLRKLWSRHYKSAKSAFGATTQRKIAALLKEHPVPDGEVSVVTEAQRPNRREARCRWCQTTVYAETGHLVGHGENIEVEHFGQCPTRNVAAGTPCALCGVTVSAGRLDAPAATMMIRESGGGRWETRHASSVDCTTNPPESHEDYTARCDAQSRAAAEQLRVAGEADERRRQQRAKRKAAREAAARKAEEEEIARVATLTETSRSSVNLHDKGLGGNRRAALDEITISLSDGTTTTRWEVRVYSKGSGWTGEDGDPDEGQSTEHTNKQEAQFAYRRWEFSPPRRERERNTRNAGTCAECLRWVGARFPRQDNSGIPGLVCAKCNLYARYELSFA
ncbi:hypothetical protein [Salinispora vitiensis]|uniref:hypothetical protein n=1 Tax=Salinispora vitiensis TaxID=999544 RepID=UPI000379E839|nr:hypothetical protein [Salinispora vitiensis]